jgi:hypothetical protein
MRFCKLFGLILLISILSSCTIGDNLTRVEFTEPEEIMEAIESDPVSGLKKYEDETLHFQKVMIKRVNKIVDFGYSVVFYAESNILTLGDEYYCRVEEDHQMADLLYRYIDLTADFGYYQEESFFTSKISFSNCIIDKIYDIQFIHDSFSYSSIKQSELYSMIDNPVQFTGFLSEGDWYGYELLDAEGNHIVDLDILGYEIDETLISQEVIIEGLFIETFDSFEIDVSSIEVVE